MAERRRFMPETEDEVRLPNPGDTMDEPRLSNPGDTMDEPDWPNAAATADEPRLSNVPDTIDEFPPTADVMERPGERETAPKKREIASKARKAAPQARENAAKRSSSPAQTKTIWKRIVYEYLPGILVLLFLLAAGWGITGGLQAKQEKRLVDFYQTYGEQYGQE